jgi:dipeptidyl aminopeptidase/acylaminoacyl peptidase
MNLTSSFLGGSPLLRPDLAKAASPISYIQKNCPPFLIIHGDHDTIVPPAQSIELNNRLKEEGIDCTLMLLPGIEHNVYSVDIEKKIVEFFDRTMKKKL